jgi:hypothetical protein
MDANVNTTAGPPTARPPQTSKPRKTWKQELAQIVLGSLAFLAIFPIGFLMLWALNGGLAAQNASSAERDAAARERVYFAGMLERDMLASRTSTVFRVEARGGSNADLWMLDHACSRERLDAFISDQTNRQHLIARGFARVSCSTTPDGSTVASVPVPRR